MHPRSIFLKRRLRVGLCSDFSNDSVGHGEWLHGSLIGVATDEVLEEELRVGEVGRVVLE